MEATVFGQDVFEILGYHKEVFDGGGYLGSMRMEEPDREVMGYGGRREEYITGLVRKGSKIHKVDGYFMTECVPLCGKIKTDRFKVLENAVEWRNQVR